MGGLGIEGQFNWEVKMAGSILDLQNKHFPHDNLFLFNFLGEISAEVEDKHPLPTQLQSLRLHLHFPFLVETDDVSEESDVEVLGTSENNFRLLLGPSSDRC